MVSLAVNSQHGTLYYSGNDTFVMTISDFLSKSLSCSGKPTIYNFASKHSMHFLDPLLYTSTIFKNSPFNLLIINKVVSRRVEIEFLDFSKFLNLNKDMCTAEQLL